jgi:hypothetical protein
MRGAVNPFWRAEPRPAGSRCCGTGAEVARRAETVWNLPRTSASITLVVALLFQRDAEMRTRHDLSRQADDINAAYTRIFAATLELHSRHAVQQPEGPALFPRPQHGAAILPPPLRALPEGRAPSGPGHPGGAFARPGEKPAGVSRRAGELACAQR